MKLIAKQVDTLKDVAPEATQDVDREILVGASSSVIRLHQSYVHFAKPVISRKIPIEAIQAFSAIIDAMIIFCAGFLILPMEGFAHFAGAAGLALAFVFVRAILGGYSRSIVRKTP